MRNCRRALAAIVLAMPVTILAMMFGSKVSGEMMGVPVFLWMLGSSALAWYAFVQPLDKYRGPQCERVLPRAEEAGPRIVFRCESCGVDWDVERTGG